MEREQLEKQVEDYLTKFLAKYDKEECWKDYAFDIINMSEKFYLRREEALLAEIERKFNRILELEKRADANTGFVDNPHVKAIRVISQISKDTLQIIEKARKG